MDMIWHNKSNSTDVKSYEWYGQGIDLSFREANLVEIPNSSANSAAWRSFPEETLFIVSKTAFLAF